MHAMAAEILRYREELLRQSGRAILILQDSGVEPLDRLLGSPMEPGRFLHIAVGLSSAIGKMHDRGLIHKNIKPANLLVNLVHRRCLADWIWHRLASLERAPDA